MWMDDEDEPEQKAPPAAVDEKRTEALEERLFKSRTILLFGPIDFKLSRAVSERLLALSTESDEEIRLYINSQGGHVESGDTIYDLIKFVPAPVKVIGTGWVASAAAHIYLGAKKENRFCLPNTRFLLHQPSGGSMGQASDIAIQAREIVKMKARINKVISDETGQPIERVEKDTERDHWMSAQEAVEYGVVGKIVDRFDKI